MENNYSNQDMSKAWVCCGNGMFPFKQFFPGLKSCQIPALGDPAGARSLLH